MIFFAAYPLYQDEQERFICNTLQPGCSNVCYDIFAPVSHFRFWLIQTMSVLLPYTVFGVYILHHVARKAVKSRSLPYRRYKEIKDATGHKVPKKPSKGTVKKRVTYESDDLDVPDFSGSYIVQLLLRLLIEASFGVGHYYLFGFFVPRRFSCYHSPCTSVVDCYISRPTEKSIMILFIWGLSGCSFLLSLVDLVFAFRTNAVRNSRNKLLLERFRVEEKCGPGLPYRRGSQTPVADTCSNGHACFLGRDVKEGPSFKSQLTSQQAVNSNLNSNSNKSCAAVVNQDVKAGPLQQQEVSSEQLIYNQQSSSPKGTLTFKSQDGCHHGIHSCSICTKPSVHYSTLERKASDIQSVCSNTGCSKTKKSEWV